MKPEYTYFEMLLRKIGITASPKAIAYMYEASRVVARKKGKTNLKDMVQIEMDNERDFPEAPIQWSAPTHRENHQI